MTSYELLLDLPGGKNVAEWFGGIPNFHDAKIVGVDLIQGKSSTLRLYAWNMLFDAVDENGYFLTDKHAFVDICFATVDSVDLTNFDFEHVGIVGSLQFSGCTSSTKVSWRSSVGVSGSIQGSGVSLLLTPNPDANF